MTERERIAVVGIDCRFPGARDPAEFWELLMDGRDGTREVPPGRWDAREYHCEQPPPGSRTPVPTGRSNTLRGGFIDDADAFDPAFFGISPHEAEAMDPQQRLLLQCAWRALEDAVTAPEDLAGGGTGVFVGVMGNEWAFLQAERYEDITARFGAGNGYFMGANRVSYHLDLKGPSLAVDSACSSSLVAVHLARKALLDGECDHAVAGGTNLIMTPALNIFYTQAGLSAPDGRCKPFSAAADGIGRSEGVAAVVLRRLSDALADRQPVYAVISGSAVGQDGRSNGITAPSRWAQQDLVARAWRGAGVTADGIRFVEAHGTGTVLGDMMETKALGQLNTARARGSGSCALGSVKGNFGHAEGAAGIAGLVKAVLALHHRTVPPSRFAGDENARLDLARRRLALLRSPLRLPPGTVHAGVSSFGIGGTNAHVVVSTAPRAVHRPSRNGGSGGLGGACGAPGVFTVSADSPGALRRNLLVQAAALERQPGDRLAQLCWTSNQVKSRLPYRASAAAAHLPTLVAALRDLAADPGWDNSGRKSGGREAVDPGTPAVAFAFTGQGAQHPAMAASWYSDSPAYARRFDEIDALLAEHLDGRSVRDAVLGGDERVHRTGLAQPALFAVEYAMYGALVEAGIRPSSVIGHSVGEFAAACAAGALAPRDAARLVARRGTLMERLPEGGGMAAVALGAAETAALIENRPLLALAAVNGPRGVVVSGDLAELDRFREESAQRGVDVRPLTVSHAFHSPLMRPMVERFGREAAGVTAGEPAIPFYSTLHGRALESGERLDAGYWAEQVTAPVRFADAAAALLAAGTTHVVEIGPRGTLTPLLRELAKQPPGDDRTARCHAAHPGGGRTGPYRLHALLGELWAAGVRPDWDAVYEDADRVPRRLPPYVFDDTFRSWRTARRAGARPDEPARPGTETADVPDADAVGGIAELTRRLVRRVCGHRASLVSDRSRLHEDLGFDSIMVMELKTRIEQALPSVGSLPVEELLASLETVGDLARYLQTQARDTERNPAAPG